MTQPIHHYTPNAWQGNNYRSGMDIKDIARAIRKELKEATPECKWSIRIERYSGGKSLYISLMEAPFDAIKAVRRESFAGGEHKFIIEPVKEQYAQINHYHLDNYSNEDEWAGVNNGYVLHEDAIKALKHATHFANSFNFDDSDSMIDYFHTNFYLHLEIGRWNKPFVNTLYVEEIANECESEECGRCVNLDACFEPAPKNPVTYEDYSI